MARRLTGSAGVFVPDCWVVEEDMAECRMFDDR